MTLIDRTRILTRQRCPRERWWGYHYLGTGIQRKARALPLAFGSAFHEGCPDLLAGDVETAVYRALKYLNDQFRAHAVGFDGEESADVAAAAQYGREEQCALAEALLRGWWAWEGERFLRDFEVLEVEKEGRAILTDPYLTDDDGHSAVRQESGITLMFRPDALVRERETGDLYVVSWKTRASHGKRSVEQDKHDMQSISEVWGLVAHSTNHCFMCDNPYNLSNGCCDQCGSSNRTPMRIEGVLYKVSVKGKRMRDDWDGLWKQNTHLIYGWHRQGRAEADSEDEWSWAYAWDDESEINSKTGKPVNHKLGKGWQKVPIWRDYPGGAKAWVEGLAANLIFPRHKNALEQVFPQAMPVERRADEIESWKRQIISQETKIAQIVDGLVDGQMTPNELDEFFPQYTHSCSAYSGCPMADICWNQEIGRDPIGSGLYIARTANHPEHSGDEE